MYRVTPKRNKWIVQRVSDRKQCGKPFEKKTDAKEFMDKLFSKAPQQTSEVTVHEAYKGLVDWKDKQSGPGKKLGKKSTDVYGYDYRKRISIFMENKLLSDFKQTDMEAYLTKAFDAGYPYKTLKMSVQFFKEFLKRMRLEGKNPCMDVIEFKVDKFNYILPKDQDLMFKKDVVMIDDNTLKQILSIYYQEAPTKPDSAATFALFAIMFFTGLRIAEIQGLKKSSVDLEDKLLHVKGVYNPAEGGFLNKTKNRASTRALELDENALKFFDWYLHYLNKHNKYNVYLIPSPVTDGPRGYKNIRKLVWLAYARMGLAEIIMDNGYPVVKKSALKGSPTKSFRHKFCTALVEAMNSNPLLTANYVKQSAGHSQLATTVGIYGNKKIIGTTEERKARAAAKQKALNTNIIPIPRLIAKN